MAYVINRIWKQIIIILLITSAVTVIASADTVEDFSGNYVSDLEALLEEYPVQEKTDEIADDTFATGRLIVYGNCPICDSAVEIIQRNEESYILQFASAEEAEKEFNLLKGKGIDVVADKRISLSLEAISTKGVYQSYGPDMMNFKELASNSDYTSSEVIVAVLDSGIQKDLYKDRILEGYNAVDGISGADSITDTIGHGTKVSSVIMDAAENNVKVLPIKVTDPDGYSSILAVELGILYSIEHDVDVINMSLDYVGPDAKEQTFWDEAITSAIEHSIPVVVASGNAGNSTDNAYPACYEPVWTIGAVDSSKARCSFSNYGTVDFVAPGKNISCLGTDNIIHYENGTSFSSPLIAALTAQLKSSSEYIGIENLYDEMLQMCIDLGEEGWDRYYGYGLPYISKTNDTSHEQEICSHVLSKNDAKPASCTTEGNSEYWICEKCGKYYSDEKAENEIAENSWVIEPTGHIWDSHYTVDVKEDCITEGRKSIHCLECDATTDSQIIPSDGHYEVQDRGKEASCIEPGLTDGSHCNTCGEILKAQQSVPAKGHSFGEATLTTKATTKSDGAYTYTCSACGEKKTEYIPMVSSVKLSTTEYTYNGKSKKPSVKVKDSLGNTLVKDTDYTVTYASGRKNVGKYKVTVKGKGKYSFTKTLYFKINPKGTSISSFARAKKAFTVRWKKQTSKMTTSRITGYQIRYSTSSKMISAKTVTVSGYTKYSKKIRKLKKKKKYYVQVRTYKTISGTKYYSSWSAKKSVTTK